MERGRLREVGKWRVEVWWGICVVGIFCVVWNMFGIWVGNRIGVVCGVVGGGWCGVWCGVWYVW